MIIGTFEKQNRRCEIHQDGASYVVKLYEDSALVEIKTLTGYSIHYAESLAENYVDGIGSFGYNDERTFLRD